MATIRTKLKQLRDADVRYISLVDRAATRIPFRVLKREKENEMGIDLTKVFKSDDSVKPRVSALVVFAQKNEAAGTQVHDAITAHGFTTDRVQKSDEGETLVYAQGEAAKDAQIVRLSDQTLVSVVGLPKLPGWVGEMAQEHGFLPDLQTVNHAMQEQLAEIITKSDTPQAETEALLIGYAEYLNQMAILPTAVFKLDATISEIVKKCTCEEKTEAEKGELKKGNPAAEVLKEETEAEKKKRLKEHPPAEMAVEDEDAEQGPPPEETKKQDDVTLAILKGIETTVAGLAAEMKTVATEQANQKKVLDDVVQKSETLNTTLKATVTATPVPEDRPAHSTRMRVAKSDEDPRTGNFDTAFLRRQR